MTFGAKIDKVNLKLGHLLNEECKPTRENSNLHL